MPEEITDKELLELKKRSWDGDLTSADRMLMFQIAEETISWYLNSKKVLSGKSITSLICSDIIDDAINSLGELYEFEKEKNGGA